MVRQQLPKLKLSVLSAMELSSMDLAIAQKKRKTVEIHSPIIYKQLCESRLKVPKSK